MVTLTGTFTRLDGAPASGMVRVTPSRSPIMDPDGKVVISGPQTFALDKDGKLVTEIPASNDPDLGSPFTFTVSVELTHASWKISKVWIPHGSATVDLSEIGDYQPVPGVATRVVTIPADGADGQVLVWDGAGFTWMDVPAGEQGPPGEVTTAALTTALAGKVTGSGMTVRVDTTVGTRVLLDHPGGSLMLSGDTGWRTITSWDTAGVVTGAPLSASWQPAAGYRGYLAVRRIDDTLFFTHLGLERIDNSNTSVWAGGYAVPYGLRPERHTVVLPAVMTGVGGLMWRADGALWRLSGAMIGADGALSTNVAVVATATVSDLWPSTLPGSPGLPA